MELLVTILIVYGISAIITISKIFEPLRDFAEKHSPNFWKHLTSCMQCLPFWVGVFVSYVMGVPFIVDNQAFPESLNLFFCYLFAGSLFSGTTMLIHTLFVFVKGNLWIQREEKEKKRKAEKGLV